MMFLPIFSAILLCTVSCIRLYDLGNDVDGQVYNTAAKEKDYWFEQRVNHFDGSDGRTYKQRYWLNNKYHKPGGPVFLQLGGEFNIEDEPNWVAIGQMATNYAKRYNALNVYLEHRFFGQSRPTPDTSVANMKYLTVDQALRDTANFVEYLTANLSLTDSKWIVFGGSYPGILSAWFRTKYPHLTAGAVSSSAPIKQRLGNPSYLDNIGDNFSPKCYQAFKQTTPKLFEALNDRKQWPTLQKDLGLCHPFDGSDKQNIPYAVNALFTPIFMTALTNELIPGMMTLDDICDIVGNASLPVVVRFGEINKNWLKMQRQPCLDYQADIGALKNTTWTDHDPSAAGMRQWTYMMCNEMPVFPTTDGSTAPFGNVMPMEGWYDQCNKLFGISKTQIERGLSETLLNFGGANIKGTKIVYVNGSGDPWNRLGILKNISNDTIAVFINGTAHVADMFPDLPGDPQELKNARNIISDRIGEFLRN